MHSSFPPIRQRPEIAHIKTGLFYICRTYRMATILLLSMFTAHSYATLCSPHTIWSVAMLFWTFFFLNRMLSALKVVPDACFGSSTCVWGDNSGSRARGACCFRKYWVCRFLNYSVDWFIICYSQFSWPIVWNQIEVVLYTVTFKNATAVCIYSHNLFLFFILF
jgi:hypothetical protein